MRYLPIAISVDTTDIDSRLDAIELMVLQDRLMSNKMLILERNDGDAVMSSDGMVVWTAEIKAEIQAEIAKIEARITELS